MYVIDEVQSVMGHLREGSGAEAGPRSREEQAQVLDSAVKRLQSLKRKACNPISPICDDSSSLCCGLVGHIAAKAPIGRSCRQAAVQQPRSHA